MGYSYYEEERGGEVMRCGYSVEAYCDHKNCEKVIDRSADARDGTSEIIFLCSKHKNELEEYREILDWLDNADDIDPTGQLYEYIEPIIDAIHAKMGEYYDACFKPDDNFISIDKFEGDSETVSPAPTQQSVGDSK